jgi:hypothetical protein
MLRLTLDGSGLLAWDTVNARIDDDGTPHPQAAMTTPCGQRGDPVIRNARTPEACGQELSTNPVTLRFEHGPTTRTGRDRAQA